MIVAIDGPAGAGKSTVARATARALGFQYLDTGAMYRAAGLADDPVAADLRLADGRVFLDGADVTEEIRTPTASERASVVAADPAVREAMVAKQRVIMSLGDWVAEGRDIGTVVAPQAEVKVFLTASPQERARRRAAELGVDVTSVLQDQTIRDERDRTRAASPLVAAEGSVELDTTGLTIDDVVARIATLAGAHA
ncbi:MAG: cytidylate kinase [Solirubrobacterales bacterium]|jgi:cytidylate kinase|nr:cytidylate kinase [Solirubrobacterales bacterium]